MVVSFFDTHLAQRTVFASSRFVKLAGFTLLFWLEHQVIVLEAFEGLMFGRGSDVAWLNSASFVITEVTGKHQYAACVFVVLSDVWTWHVTEAVTHVGCVATNSAEKVYNLYDRICLIT